MQYSNLLTGEFYTVDTLTNPTKDETGDGATLTIDSNSDEGTLYSYSKTTPFNGTPAEKAAEIMANGVGQAPVVGTNTRVVTGQAPLTPYYAGWVQDSDGYGADMVLVFNMGAGETLTIPGGAGTYDFHIDWGEGVEEDLTTVGAGPHTYTDAIEAVVRISGVFPHIYFNNGGDRTKLIEILQLGDVGWTSCSGSFNGCDKNKKITVGVSDTSNVADFSFMFRNNTALAEGPDLRQLDVSSGTNFFQFMSSMTGALTPPKLGGLDTSSATNMGYFGFSWSSMGAVDVEFDTWDVGAVTNFASFLQGSQLTTACYDDTLESWGNQTLAAGAASTTIHFGTSQYSLSSQGNRDLLEAQVAGIIDSGVAP